MSKHTCGAAGLIWLLTTMAFTAEPAFQFTRPIEIPSLEREELLSVRLDSPIYDATQTGQEDLRLLDDAGQIVPFLLRQIKTTRTQTVRQTWMGKILSARPTDDGGLEITLRLDPDDPAPNGLTLVTPLDNFEKRVRVETSADGGQWEEVAHSLIFDYSRYVDVRHDSVSFPQTDRRHVRVLIDNVTAKEQSELLELTRRLEGAKEISREERISIQRRPFRVDRIDFWQERAREVPKSDVTETYPGRSFQVEQDPKEKQTQILIGMRQEPITSLTIETPEQNFSRHAIVEVEDVDGVRRSWRAIGEATLTRIDFQGFAREHLSIRFPEERERKFRIVLENRDNPPLNITGVIARGNIYEVDFLAKPGRSYRLDYGDADAEAAETDQQVLEKLLEADFVPRPAKLGEQQPRKSEPEAFRWSAILNNRVILGAMIFVLVIVLGIGLYGASRRLDHTPPESAARCTLKGGPGPQTNATRPCQLHQTEKWGCSINSNLAEPGVVQAVGPVDKKAKGCDGAWFFN